MYCSKKTTDFYESRKMEILLDVKIAQKVYEYNGAIYLFSAKNFVNKGLAGFSKIKKSVMPKWNSIDIDDLTDFMIASI